MRQETFKNTVAAQGDIGTEINVGVGVSVISSSTGIGSTDPSPVQVVGFGTTAITTSKLLVQTQEIRWSGKNSNK